MKIATVMILASSAAAFAFFRDKPNEPQPVKCCEFAPSRVGTREIPPPAPEPNRITFDCPACPGGARVVWYVEPFGVLNGSCTGCELLNQRRYIENTGGCQWEPYATDNMCWNNGGTVAVPYCLYHDNGEWILTTGFGSMGPEWSCPADRWDCMGRNILTMRQQDRAGGCRNWPQQVVLTPW